MDRSPRDNFNYYTGNYSHQEEPYGYDEEVIFCPYCDHDLPEELGTLGNTRHFRCQNCGADFNEYDIEEG